MQLPTIFRFGLLAGIGLILWEVLAWLLGAHGPRMGLAYVFSIFAVLVPVFVFFTGLRRLRDKDSGGMLTLRQGIVAGLRMALIMTAVAALYMAIYATFIAPAYPNRRQAFIREGVVKQLQLKDPGMPEAQRERMALERAPDLTPGQFVFRYAVLQFCGGLLTGLVVTLLLRREPAPSGE